VLGFAAVRGAEAAMQFGSAEQGLSICWNADADMIDAGWGLSYIHDWSVSCD